MLEESDEQLKRTVERELVRAQSVLATLPESMTQEIADQNSYVIRCQQILMDLDYLRRI